MTPEELRALALEMADSLNTVKRQGESFPARNPVINAYAIEFALAFLTAVQERAEPVAWRIISKITGATTLTQQTPGIAIELGQLHITPLYAHPAHAVPDVERDAHPTKAEALEALDTLDDFCRMETSIDPYGPREALKAFIEATEPAPQESDTRKDSGNAPKASLKAFLQPPVGAAPLPAGVAALVDRLIGTELPPYLDGLDALHQEAANMIERLATKRDPYKGE